MTDGIEVGRAHVAVTADARAAVRSVQQDFTRNMPTTGKRAGGVLSKGLLVGVKGIAGPIAALFAVSKVVDFFKAANEEAREAQKVGARTTNVIKTTGGAANVTAKQVGALATAISKKSGIDDEVIQSGANVVLTFSRIRNEAGKGNDVFNRTTQLATDMGAAMGKTTASQAKVLGKALNDPIKGMSSLSRVGITFTDSQKKQVAAMVKSGDVLGAQKLILADVEKRYAGAAAAGATAGDKLRVSWDNFKEQIGTAILPLLDRLATFISGTIIPAASRLVSFLSGLGPRLRAAFSGGGGGGFFSGLIAQARQIVAVIAPIIRQIVGALVGQFQKMRPQIQSIWTSVKTIVVGVMIIIREVISSVTNIIRMVWARWGKQITAIVVTVFRGMVNIISGVMKAIAGIIKLVVALIRGDWRGAWNAIKQIFSGVWQAIRGILTVATAAMRAVLAAWWAKVRALWTSATTAVRNTWTNFWSAIRTATTNAINAVHDKIRTVLDKIKNAFSTAKDNIRRIWAGVQDVVSKPVRWIVDHVYNSPLVPVWNRVAGLVSGPKLSAYARGGVEPFGVRPGYTPGRDTHPIMVGGGEAIMRPEFTRAVGKDWVERANRAARRGKARRFVQEGGIPAFAGGGVVDWLKGVVSSAGAKVSGLAGKIKDWVLGGLRVAAEKVLSPVKGVIDRAMPNSGVGRTVGGVGKKAIDLVLDKIKTEDDKAMAALAASAGGQGAYTGPPGKGSRGLTTWHGGRFTQRFRNTLEQAQRLAGTFINVIQGGFRPATSYSGTSHRGDAIDTSWRPAVLSGLRRAGVAAWHRTPAQGFAHHIHGVPLPGRGFPGGSGIWQAQDYLRGGNGLARGGIAPPGWSIVGERGRELMFAPDGGRVYSNQDSKQMLGSGVNIYGGQFGYTPEQVGAAILREQRHQQALNPVFG
jgi:hypothetical protein